MSHLQWALGILLLVLLPLVGCEAPTKGACVSDMGVGYACAEMTDAECALVNGDAFYEGKTCKDLGLGN